MTQARPEAEEKRLKVVLDLDEMLIHTYNIWKYSRRTLLKSPVMRLQYPKKSLVSQYGAQATYTQNQFQVVVDFIKRPWLSEFLSELAKLDVEVIFWTASDQLYADAVLKEILPMSLMGCKRYYRQDCSRGRVMPKNVEIHYKDLKRVFSEVELKRAVLFDDTKTNFTATPKNGILCPKYKGKLQSEPMEPSFLEMTINNIHKLIECPDVRDLTKEIEAETWELVKPLSQNPKIEEASRKSSPRKSFSLMQAFKGISRNHKQNNLHNAKH